MKPDAEKSVKIAQLKARLSEYVRAARQGRAITVCDRDTPVARLVPYQMVRDDLPSTPPTRPWGTLKAPRPLSRGVDSLAALLEERQSSR